MAYYTRTDTGQQLQSDRIELHGFPFAYYHVVNTREHGDIPGIVKALDIFVEEDGYLVIKSPSKPYRPAY